MKLFAIDSPLMNVLSKISDLMLLNLLTILMCIPVITAGASFTAMHYCCLKLARDHETSMVKQFFHSFKENFWQSTIIWLIFLAIMAFLGVDLFLMYQNPTGMSTYIFGGLLAVLLLVLFGGCMVFPIQAKFANPIIVTLKTGFYYSFKGFFKTLLMLVVKLIPLAMFFIGNLGLMLFPIILFFCFSAPGFVAAKLYDKTFQEAEDIILARQSENEAADEDKTASAAEKEIAVAGSSEKKASGKDASSESDVADDSSKGSENAGKADEDKENTES